MAKRAGLRWLIVCLTGVFLIVVMPFSVHASKQVEMRIIGMFDLTGPYAGLHQIFVKATNDFVSWANKEPNYLPPGVKIKYEIYDTGADIGKAVAAWQIATSKKPTPIITMGGSAAHTILGIKPLAKRSRIPCIDGSSARPVMVPPGWAFSMQPCYEGLVAAAAQFLKDNWHANTPYKLIRNRYEKNKDRNPRLAIIGWNNTFGRAFDQKEVRDYVRKIGVDYINPEYISPSPTDTTPQVLRLVDEGVDMIYFGMLAETHAFVLKDASRMGIRKKFQDMAFSADNIIQLKNYIPKISQESMMLSSNQPDMDEWNPVFKDMFIKTGMNDNAALGYSLPQAWFDMYVELIRRAVKKVGAENVNGELIYEIITSMSNYKPMAYNSNITFTKTKRYAADFASIYQNQNGKIVKVEKSIYIPNLLPGGKDVVK